MGDGSSPDSGDSGVSYHQPLTPYRHQRRVAAHNRAADRSALPAPDDADEEEIELEDDNHSDLPGDFVQGP